MDTLMVYHHAKNLTILSMDEKEKEMFLCLQTNRRTHTQTQTDNNSSSIRVQCRSTEKPVGVLEIPPTLATPDESVNTNPRLNALALSGISRYTKSPI